MTLCVFSSYSQNCECIKLENSYEMDRDHFLFPILICNYSYKFYRGSFQDSIPKIYHPNANIKVVNLGYMLSDKLVNESYYNAFSKIINRIVVDRSDHREKKIGVKILDNNENVLLDGAILEKDLRKLIRNIVKIDKRLKMPYNEENWDIVIGFIFELSLSGESYIDPFKWYKENVKNNRSSN